MTMKTCKVDSNDDIQGWYKGTGSNDDDMIMLCLHLVNIIHDIADHHSKVMQPFLNR